MMGREENGVCLCISWKALVKGVVVLINFLVVAAPFIVEWLALRHVWDMLMAAHVPPVAAATLYGEYFVLFTGLSFLVTMMLVYNWNWDGTTISYVGVGYGIVCYFLFYLPAVSGLMNHFLKLYASGCAACIDIYWSLNGVALGVLLFVVLVQFFLAFLLYLLQDFFERHRE